MARLVIRADASASVGTGHVMRCLALADEWQKKGGEVLFLQAETTPALHARVSRFETISMDESVGTPGDAQKAARLAGSGGWVVTDGYRFPSEYQRWLHDGGVSHLMIDDHGKADFYEADLVVNPNTTRLNECYRGRSSDTQLLAGPRYAFLREEFLLQRSAPRSKRDTATRVLVTMGGSDPSSATEEVMNLLCGFENLEVTVLIGGSNPRAADLRARFAARPNVDIVSDSREVAELMANTDLAIAAAGTTAWELAHLGVPSILLIVAGNQEVVAGELGGAGAVRVVDWRERGAVEVLQSAVVELISKESERQRLSDVSRRLVDGLGLSRVRTRIAAREIHLRPAEDSDCSALWEIANDPVVRANSFQTAPIPWDSHVSWFEKRLKDPHCRLHVASHGDVKNAGYIRFDLHGEKATISIGLHSSCRGRGLGAPMISKACGELLRTTSTMAIEAVIKVENQASRSAFESADFDEVPSALVDGACRYTFPRNRMFP